MRAHANFRLRLRFARRADRALSRAERRASRLLKSTEAHVLDCRFADLPVAARAGDLLVFNDTACHSRRATRAGKETGGSQGRDSDRAHRRRARRDRAAPREQDAETGFPPCSLKTQQPRLVTVTGRDGELFRLEFSHPHDCRCSSNIGEVPVAALPRARRRTEDVERYQTVYANGPGAVAAPTAGLHFDEAMLEETTNAAMGVQARLGHAARRCGHVSESCAANTSRRTACTRNGSVHAACCDAVRNDACHWWAGHCRRHDGRSSARVRVCSRHDRTVRRRDGPVYPAGLRVPQRRRDDHQLSSAEIVAADARRRVRGSRTHSRAYEHAVREKYRFFSYGDSMFLTPRRCM